jgi:hypothetical protein
MYANQMYLNTESRLLLAMQHQDVPQLRSIMSEPQFDPDMLFHVPFGTEMPALCLALQRRMSYVAQLLIEAGASVNRTDSHGKAPLHHAVLSELKDVLQLLVKSRADVNAKCPPGFTSLHFACQANKPRKFSSSTLLSQTVINVFVTQNLLERCLTLALIRPFAARKDWTLLDWRVTTKIRSWSNCC